jgi:hypothetical protein
MLTKDPHPTLSHREREKKEFLSHRERYQEAPLIF